jgi:hypothetical protein
LFERNPNLEQGYAMRKGNKSDYLVTLKKFLGDSWRETDTLPDSETPYAMVVDATLLSWNMHMKQSYSLPELLALTAYILLAIAMMLVPNVVCKAKRERRGSMPMNVAVGSMSHTSPL